MELTVSCSLRWKGQWVEAGGTIAAESPEDDELLAYYAKFSAFQSPAPPGEPPASGETPPEGETGATPPISTSDAPGVVGRRIRDRDR